MNYMLGKLPVRHDKRTLRFPKYMKTLPPVKPQIDWSLFVANWGMMANDQIGDCTCAAAGHLIELWTSAASDLVIPSDTDIVAAYSAITGYNPSDPASDQGANELDVLNFWRNTGIAGHKIGAYAKVDQTNHDFVKIAADMFGGVYIGMDVTQTMMDAFDQQKPWMWPEMKGHVVGGHAIPVVKYDPLGLWVVTWGKLQFMDWQTWDAFVDEVYVIYSQDFVNGVNSPSGFDAASLLNDLALL